MMNVNKYEKQYFMPPAECMDWAKKDSVEKAISDKIHHVIDITEKSISIPETRKDYIDLYNDTAQFVDKLAMAKYTKAQNDVVEWIKSQDDLSQARKDLYANNVPDRTLSPENIKLGFDDQGEWILDASASTSERTVLYYKNILSANGGVTPIFLKTLQVQNGFDLIVKEKTVSESNEYKVIEYSHPYDGYSMNISVEVDAVQTYDAAEAIKSAWGVEATLADGVITEIK